MKNDSGAYTKHRRHLPNGDEVDITKLSTKFFLLCNALTSPTLHCANFVSFKAQRSGIHYEREI